MSIFFKIEEAEEEKEKPVNDIINLKFLLN